jgi:hypothetical protein
LALQACGAGHAGGGGVGASANGLVDDVDGVAAADEELAPAFAVVRGAEDVAAVLVVPWIMTMGDGCSLWAGIWYSTNIWPVTPSAPGWRVMPG